MDYVNSHINMLRNKILAQKRQGLIDYKNYKYASLIF